ncbi:MAG: 2-polyprenylphenol 6-hydroxylase [Alphaproteobacteria bacterium]|nr:2-polyprenylphenol 6-hydroxylase [Alphaproteobacteria bacterium]
MLKPLKMLRLILAQDAFLPASFRGGDFKPQAPLWMRGLRRVFILGSLRFTDTDHQKRREDLVTRIAALGPSYIKLGQFLSTRADMIGATLAADLAHLQDRLPPFPEAQVQATLAQSLSAYKDNPDHYFTNLSAPIAAASIAQVHQAQDPNDATKKYAVKILRPNIERILTAELKGFMRLARLCERFIPATRRLRPCASIAILQQSMAQEVDLRKEAAALSEMAENTRGDYGFRVPQVIWAASTKDVLVMEWVEAIAISDIAALRAAHHNMAALSTRLIEVFLTLALRDGFFHADMHQGNILVEADSCLVGIDLGITGRLDEKSRHFLAEILHGFITRDYRRVARVHYQAGYVPPSQIHGHTIEDFAQALRAIGEPIRDSKAADISLSHLLTQLFAVTARFDMETQPQLLLLQKTMVNVEGVARSLNPQINFWDAAEPVVRKWLEEELGFGAFIKQLQTQAPLILPQMTTILQHLHQFPAYLQTQAEKETGSASPPVSAPIAPHNTLASGGWWLLVVIVILVLLLLVMIIL